MRKSKKLKYIDSIIQECREKIRKVKHCEDCLHYEIGDCELLRCRENIEEYLWLDF